jgi:hypothetical protein
MQIDLHISRCTKVKGLKKKQIRKKEKKRKEKVKE